MTNGTNERGEQQYVYARLRSQTRLLVPGSTFTSGSRFGKIKYQQSSSPLLDSLDSMRSIEVTCPFPTARSLLDLINYIHSKSAPPYQNRCHVSGFPRRPPLLEGRNAAGSRIAHSGVIINTNEVSFSARELSVPSRRRISC